MSRENPFAKMFLLEEGRRALSSSAPPSLDDPMRDCDARTSVFADMLVHERGSAAIEMSASQQMIDAEREEIATRERAAAEGKARLKRLQDEHEAETSEQEEERQHTMQTLVKRIAVDADAVRAPVSRAMDVASHSRPEPENLIVHQAPDPARAGIMWQPFYSERARRREEQRVPFMHIYRDNLDSRNALVRSLISATGPRTSLGTSSHAEYARASLRLIPRRVEENDLLRTPLTGERYCANGYECEMYKLFKAIAADARTTMTPRASVECLDKEDLLELERSGNYPTAQQPCLGCRRHEITWRWNWLRRKGEDASTNLIAGHYNLTGMRGEYAYDQTIQDASLGLPLPVVPFFSGAFSLEEGTLRDQQVVYFRQIGMVELTESHFA